MKAVKTCKPLDPNQSVAAALYRDKFLACPVTGSQNYFYNGGVNVAVAGNYTADGSLGAVTNAKPYGNYYIFKNVADPSSCIESQNAQSSYPSEYTVARRQQLGININPTYQYFYTRRKIGADCYDFWFVNSFASFSAMPQTANVQCTAGSSIFSSDFFGNKNVHFSINDLANNTQNMIDSCNAAQDSQCDTYVSDGFCVRGPDIMVDDGVCSDGSGEGLGQYKDTKKQNYCSARQVGAECNKVFGCTWNGAQCNRKITCSYSKAPANAYDLLCSRYTGNQSGCSKFASCQYAGGTCSKR